MTVFAIGVVAVVIPASLVRRWLDLGKAIVLYAIFALILLNPADMGEWMSQVWPLTMGLTILACAVGWFGRRLVEREDGWGYAFRLVVISAPLIWGAANCFA